MDNTNRPHRYGGLTGIVKSLAYNGKSNQDKREFNTRYVLRDRHNEVKCHENL